MKTGGHIAGMFRLALGIPVLLSAQQKPLVLKIGTALEGRGKTLRQTIIVVEGSTIARVGGSVPAAAVVYDLTGLTVSPGWIDTHAHIMNHFDNSNRLAGRNEPPAERLLHAGDDLVLTLEAGFTTLPHPGQPSAKAL